MSDTAEIDGHHHPTGELDGWDDAALRFHLGYGAHGLGFRPGPPDLDNMTRTELVKLHDEQFHYDSDPYRAAGDPPTS